MLSRALIVNGVQARNCSNVKLGGLIKDALSFTAKPDHITEYDKSEVQETLSTHRSLPDPERVKLADLMHPPKVLPAFIEVTGEVDDLTPISGIPQEHTSSRRMRIFMPAKSSTQSGTNDIHVWKMEPDTRERWENPLMGWSSSGDPLSNIAMNMDFATKEDAVRLCDKNGWQYDVVEPQLMKLRHKSYGDNYHWSRRTRRAFK